MMTLCMCSSAGCILQLRVHGAIMGREDYLYYELLIGVPMIELGSAVWKASAFILELFLWPLVL